MSVEDLKFAALVVAVIVLVLGLVVYWESNESEVA